MKYILIGLLIWFAWMLIAYGTTAYTSLITNPFEWDEGTRIGIVVFGVCFGLVISILGAYMFKVNDYKP